MTVRQVALELFRSVRQVSQILRITGRGPLSRLESRYSPTGPQHLAFEGASSSCAFVAGGRVLAGKRFVGATLKQQARAEGVEGSTGCRPLHCGHSVLRCRQMVVRWTLVLLAELGCAS